MSDAVIDRNLTERGVGEAGLRGLFPERKSA